MTQPHAPTCPGPEMSVFIGREGDRLSRCRACGWFVVLDDDAETTGTAPRKVPTRLVCREHHKPVTANGKGCRACANDHAQRTAARKRRKGKPETTE